MKKLSQPKMKNSWDLKFDLKMKFSALFLLVTMFTVQANSYSQKTKISLDMENKTVESIIDEIEAKTEFKFVFDTEEVDLNRTLTLKVNNLRIEKVLNKLFGMTDTGFELIDRKIILRKKSAKKSSVEPSGANKIAQQQINGVVTDEQGAPLPGANVLEKGTNNGVVTDFDGNFIINTAQNSTLVVSYLGFETKEVNASANSSMTIVLKEEANTLNEVVVTALNIKRAEKTIGYATQRVKGDELEEANETNLVNALSGKIAGVQVTNAGGGIGASSSIVLRGTKSLSGKNQPLFVVDGVPISNEIHSTTRSFEGPKNPNDSGFEGTGDEQQVDFGNAAGEVNPADIASIQVLKGANAAALYGSRAANGVILITTKSGQNQRGLGISINSSITLQNPLKTPRFQTQFGKGRNGLYAYPDLNNDAGVNFGPRFEGQLIPQYDPNNPDTPILRPWVNRLGSDPVRDFLRTGTTMTNGFSITNGTEKGNFRLSYTRLDQEGMVPNTDLTRNSISLNASYKPTPKFTIGANVNYINSGSDNRPNMGA